MHPMHHMAAVTEITHSDFHYELKPQMEIIPEHLLPPGGEQHEQGTKEQQRSQEKTPDDGQGKKGRKEN
jgi:hypothetical protein